MKSETYIIYKKSNSADKTYWRLREVEVPGSKWSAGWDGLIEYLSVQGHFPGGGQYAVQSKVGAGFCLISVEDPIPEPKQKIEIL